MVYAEAVHAVWMEQNQRILIFEHKARVVGDITREVTYICNTRASSRHRDLVKS